MKLLQIPTYSLTLLNVNVNALIVSLKLRHYLCQILHFFDILSCLCHRKLLYEIPLNFIIFSFNFLLGNTKLVSWKVLCDEIEFLNNISSLEKL